MAGNTTYYYQQMISEISRGKLQPAYFMYGEEVFLLDDLIDKITAKFLGEAQKEINYFCRYASDTPLEEIVALMAGAGLFSEKKVIVYKDFQNLRSPKTEILKRYLKNPNSDVCLIIVARISSVSQSRFQALSGLACFVNVLPLRDAELRQWISDEFSRHNKTILSETAESMIYLVGEKIHDLQGEILHIVNAFPEKKEISAAEVEQVVGVRLTQNVFELARAMAAKEPGKALFILKTLLESGENPGSILFFLLRHIMILWKIKGFQRSGIRNDQMIQKQLRLYSRQYSQYLQELSAWKSTHLEAAVVLAGESDRALKSSQLDPQVILEMLIVRLVSLQ